MRRIAALSTLVTVSIIASPARAQSFPDKPTADTTAADYRAQMLSQLGLVAPTLPPKMLDANRPPSAYPADPTNPEGNWRNFYGHMITRSAWGLWNNYEDTSDGFLDVDGFNGWDRHTTGDPDSWRVFDALHSEYSQGAYTPINLLALKDGTPVRTARDWWDKRRPEILRDVQEELYGKIPDQSRWPAITWQLGAIVEGNDTGVAYRERTITGIIDTSRYPDLRNTPAIRATLRVPQAAFDAGAKVPVLISFGGSAWTYVAGHGWGTISFDQSALQGADTSSWIIGLINQGGWRKPDDWGALAAWSWGVSRLIDRLEAEPPSDPTLVTDANAFLGVDVKKLGIQGHSFLGKAALVTMAYEPRLLIAYPSRGGSGGTKMNRRHWGQDLEDSLGSDSEYYWYAGNAYQYVGPLAGDGPGMVAGAIDLPASGPYLGNDAATWRMLYPNAGGSTQPGTYLPRKIELLTVDAHSLVALAAPRPVFTNGGTHDSWTDPRGMWLTQVYATPVYNLLGRRGIVDRPWPFDPSHVPDDPVTPSTRLMRNFDGYILGHLGYRYAGEALHPELPDESPGSGGHTPNEDFPTFVQFAAKFFDDLTPPTLPALPDRDAVATDDGSAIVRFSASAIDAVDDNVPVVFTPASGSRFPVGTTTVMATATDVSGNVATTTFKVTVHDTLSAPMATPTMAVPGE